jgi:hypothetical protein
VVGGASGTGVAKGKNWEGVVRDYAHCRTQAATVDNTMMTRVLDECNSPSLPMSRVSEKPCQTLLRSLCRISLTAVLCSAPEF